MPLYFWISNFLALRHHKSLTANNKEISKLLIIDPLWGKTAGDPHKRPVMWKAFLCHGVPICLSHSTAFRCLLSEKQLSRPLRYECCWRPQQVQLWHSLSVVGRLLCGFFYKMLQFGYVLFDKTIFDFYRYWYKKRLIFHKYQLDSIRIRGISSDWVCRNHLLSKIIPAISTRKVHATCRRYVWSGANDSRLSPKKSARICKQILCLL